MTKAEERALEAYPNDRFVDDTYAEMCRSFYIEGYKQAVVDVCEWLEGMFGFLNENGNNFNTERFIKNFKNAMEE